jgi:hypothetical protein
MKLNPPATGKNIEEVGLILGINFPVHYKDFMLQSNGAEGNIGNNAYVAIWLSSLAFQYR